MSLATEFPAHKNGNSWPIPGISVPKGFLWDGTTLWFRTLDGWPEAAPKHFRWSAMGTLLFFKGKQGHVITENALERAQLTFAMEKRAELLEEVQVFVMIMAWVAFQALLIFFDGWTSLLFQSSSFDDVNALHFLASILVAAVTGGVLTKLCLAIWNRKDRNRLKEMGGLLKTDTCLTMKDRILQNILSQRFHNLARRRPKIFFLIFGLLFLLFGTFLGLAIHEEDFAMSFVAASFFLPTLFLSIYILYGLCGSVLGETLPAHRPYGDSLIPPFENDFASGKGPSQRGATVYNHVIRNAEEALQLRRHIWNAYPQTHTRLEEQCDDVCEGPLKEALTGESDGDFFPDAPQPEKRQSRFWRAVKWLLFPDRADTYLGYTFQGIRVFAVFVVVILAVHACGGWGDRFPDRHDSLALVKMMISGQGLFKEEKNMAAKLYPRWRDPIVIKVEGVEGLKIFSSLDRDLSMLRTLSGLPIDLAAAGAEDAANMIISYKGQLARTTQPTSLPTDIEKTSSAMWSVTFTKDKRFIRKAHITVDFDILNAKIGAIQKIEHRHKITEALTLSAIFACLGFFSKPSEEVDSLLLRSTRYITPLDGLSLYTLYDPNLPARAPYEAVADKIAERIDQALAHESLESLVAHRAAE